MEKRNPVERLPRDDEREKRIVGEIVADANGPDEQAMGWHSYLEDHLTFPFLARCSRERLTCPLRVGDEVEIVGMAPQDECEDEMFVVTNWERGPLAVPLAQIEGIHVDEEAARAIGDWHYWMGRGYEF